MARAAAIAFVMGVTSAVAGCGNDDGGDGTSKASQPGITKQEYLSAVGEACTLYLPARAVAATPLEQLLPRNPADATPAQARSAADTLDAVNEANAELLANLEAIPEPSTGSDAVAESLGLVEEAFAEYEQAAESARKGDVDAMAAGYESGTKLLADAGKVSGGFAFCG